MVSEELNDIEIAPPEVVREAARTFAAALSETGQYKVFEKALEQLDDDQAARDAIAAFQAKQQSLQMMIKLNAVSAADKAELERLQSVYLEKASVINYLQAQQALMAICRATSEILSQSIGLNYSASCGSGCCG